MLKDTVYTAHWTHRLRYNSRRLCYVWK